MIRKKIAIIFCTLIGVLILQGQVFSQVTTTFKSGTAIIDMGSATPSIKNSLKPYGLIYALLKNYSVPVSCVINQNKGKDGIDFSYNGKAYKGGTYIVSKEFLSTQVSALLNSWVNQGVVIDYTSSDLTVDVNFKLAFVPRWTMDKDYGDIAISFLSSAGIPSSAYSKKRPDQLGNCDDIFVLPHANPTWNTHNNLLFWNKNQKGPIWAGCFAVGQLENLFVDTTILGVPTRLKMNFLSTNGLLEFQEHGNGTTPYSAQFPGDPIAQYLGKTDDAQVQGAEVLYLPKIGSAWNAGSKILTYSSKDADIPSLSAGPAVSNIYGRAFDDAARGFVSYQAGHNIGGGTPDAVAAQRIFFNFSFFALNDKVTPIISVAITGAPTELKAGTASPTLTANVTGTHAGNVSYQWKAYVNGTAITSGFSNSHGATTTFTPDNAINTSTNCVITCVVTDNDCPNRVTFDSKGFTILPGTPPLVSNTINQTIAGGCTSTPLSFNVFDYNVDANAGARTLVQVTGLTNGTVATTTGGNITFTANANFVGTTVGTYKITNDGGITTSTGNISIVVGAVAQAPSVTGDISTVTLNIEKSIAVLANDANNPSAGTNDQLTIRDISVKPTKGYARINVNNTITFLSFSSTTSETTDFFNYVACNNLGYCSEGRVDISLVLPSATITQTASQDTYIASNDLGVGGGATVESVNYGNASELIFSQNQNKDHVRLPLIQFDLASLSSLAFSSALTVTSSKLIMTVSEAFLDNGVFPGTFFRLKVPWTETTVTMVNSSAGNPWVDLNQNVVNDLNGSAGANDFLTVNDDGFLTADPAFNISAPGAAIGVGQKLLTDMKEVTKYWLSDHGNGDHSTTNNFGLFLLPNNTGAATDPFVDVKFYSREASGAGAVGPQLVISYQTASGTLTTTAPIAYPDVATTTSSANTISISVLNNDQNYFGSGRNTVVGAVTSGSGTVGFTGSTVTYKAASSFVGVETITYTVEDNVLHTQSTAKVRVTVTQVAPIVLDDVATTNSFSATTINVGANDSDPQGAMTAPVITVAPKNGTAVVSGNNIIYTPSGNFTGTDVFRYQRSGTPVDVCSVALSGTATVTVTVNNQPPVARPASINTFTCAPVEIKLLDIATDPEGGVLTATNVTSPSNGTLTVNPSGSYTYTPNNGFSGTDQFTYKVKDPANATSVTSATVTITVSASPNPNTAPVAVADKDITLVNQPTFTNVLFNDTDPNNDPLTISLPSLTTTQGGTIQLLANKLVKYIPPSATFTGIDTYRYTLIDTHTTCAGTSSLSVTGIVTITVNAVTVALSGTVYNDVDISGQPDFSNIRTNTEVGTNAGGSIYVYALDNSGVVKDRVPVDDDGTYTLSSVPANTTGLKLILSIEDVEIGGTLSVGSLPVGYANSSPLTRLLPATTNNDGGGYNWGIYLNPTLTPGTIVAPANICGTSGIPGTLTTTATASGGSATSTRYKYQWQSSTTSPSSGFSDISAADSLTSYTPIGAIFTTTYYRRSVTTKDASNNNINVTVFSNVVTVTVSPKPTVSINPSLSTLAINGSVTLTASGAGTYTWSPAANLSATNTATVIAGPLTTTTIYIATGTLTTTGCTNTASITVTVIDPGTIGSSQTNCGSFTPTAFTSVNDASGGSPVTYQWQSSTVADFSSSVTTIAGAPAATYSPGLVNVTTYFRRVATINGLPVNSNVVTITVNPKPTITISPSSPAINTNGSVTLTANGASSYTWSPAANLSATTGASVTAGPLTTTSVYVITGTITATGCVNTATVTVTVNIVSNVLPGTIGSDQTICAGSTPNAFTSITLASGGTGTINYQWQQSSDNSTFTNISGATSATYAPTALSQTTYYRRAASTIIDPAVYTASLKVTVNPIPVVTVSPTSIIVAVGASTTLSASGATTYSWTPATNLSATNGASVVATTSVAGSIIYTVTGTSSGCISTASTTVTASAAPIASAITGPCAIIKDSSRTFTVSAINATRYVWTLPNGWTGTSTTNSIIAKANNTGGTITVTPFNGNIAGNTVSYTINVIDYAKVTIGGLPVTASGNKNSSITVTVTLFDVNGNRINCSGGPATIQLCDPNPGSFTAVIDNNDGTYTTSLTASANTLDLCGTIGGIPILKKSTVTFTGPQGGIKASVPQLATETPKLTFTMTEGRAPFTIIYKSAKSNKTDTLTNYTSATATGVALIPSTTLYTLVSIIDANGERRDNNFTRDTASVIVLAPRVIITLKADPAKPDVDSTWITILRVRTKNIGDMDLTNSQAKLDLRTVFPAPVTFKLDSLRYTGSTITPNTTYDGINANDLFARLHNRANNKPFADMATASDNAENSNLVTQPINTVDGASDGNIRVFTNKNGTGSIESNDETVVVQDEHSIYMFGPKSSLPIGVEADIILYLHVKPNGYTDPFIMQAVALGTGTTDGATALATSISNDNNDINSHPEITKQGDPIPTVINLFPRAVIGSSLNAGLPVLQGNGSYNVPFTIKLNNYGNLNLQSVQLGLNLLKSIGAPSTFSIVGAPVSTGDLLLNPSYDGKTDTNMLAANSILGYNKGFSTITFTVNIVPNQLSSIYRLQATAFGFSDQLNTTVSDLSTDGLDPDPDGNNIPSEKIKTVITINLPIPPLVPAPIAIKTGPTTTALSVAYCVSTTGVVVIPTALNIGGTDPYEYQWQSSTNNINFTDVVGATDSTYTTGLISSSVYLRRQVISGNQFKFSNSVFIQIYPQPAKPVISGTATQIVGKGSVVLTSTVASSYKWSTTETARSITSLSAGNYFVTITDANGCTNVSDAFAITALDPYKVADLQKVLSKAPVLQSDGTYILGFTFLSSNLRSELLDSVRIKDDLSKVFPATVDYQVTQIQASGKLKANTLFNGNSQTDLLSDVSQLGGLTKDSIQVTLRVSPNGFSGKLLNQAVLTANSPFGQFSVTSNDPTVGSGVGVRNPTPFTLPLIDIFIPSGFSPNHDGVNDNFVIIRPFGTTINLEIFNRWGNAVFKAPDYKNEWDGRGNQPNNILGEMLPDGTYYYIATATDKFTGNIRKFAGFVTLKR